MSENNKGSVKFEKAHVFSSFLFFYEWNHFFIVFVRFMTLLIFNNLDMNVPIFEFFLLLKLDGVT